MKMMEGDSASENEALPRNAFDIFDEAVTDNNNNNNNNSTINNDGGLSDLGLESTASDSGSGNEDEELAKAQAILDSLKEKKRKLERSKQLERIVSETKEVEKSLKDLESNKNKTKSGRKKLSIGSLRGMGDVQEEVNLLMDKKLNIKSIVSSEESVSCESGSDEASPRSNKRRKNDKKSLHKSGKSKTLTSYVRFPQEWPHSHLSLSFVSRPKQYEELTIAEFCAGFAAILEVETNKEVTVDTIEQSILKT